MEVPLVTDHVDLERLRGAWQAEVAGPPVVSMEDLRARAAAMGDEFTRTTWVPWVAAGGIAACFGLMLAGLRRRCIGWARWWESAPRCTWCGRLVGSAGADRWTKARHACRSIGGTSPGSVTQ